MVFAMNQHPRPLTLKRSISMTIYPTVLYIKQHSVTRMKYFGKTTQDPHKYNGSGKHWARILKKYGKEHVITLWVSEPFTDSDTITEFALAFSRDNNIVESKDWANQKPENGLDGGSSSGPRGKQQNPSKKPSHMIGKTPSDATRKKQSASHMGKISPKKGKPSGKQQNPSGPRGKRQNPSGPRGPYGPTGKQQNPHGPRGPYGKQQNPAPKVICPHCGLEGGISNMKRWHFDNCPQYVRQS